MQVTERTLTRTGVSNGSAIVPANSVLLSIRAPIGYVARTAHPVAFNQGCRGLVPNSETSPAYLVYALVACAPELESLGRGTTFTEISAAQMAALHIPIPPAEEQRAIADHLDHETAKIDTLIAKQQKLIATLRERRRAIIRHSLERGDGWVTSRMKHIAKTNLGKMLDAGRVVREGDQSTPYVRAADILADGTVRLTDLNEMPFSANEMTHFDLQRGDVLLIEGGATVGRPGFLDADAPGVAFQKTVNRLRTGPDLDARFAYWSMLALYESDYYANYFGSVSFVHLTGEKLREIPLAHPCLSEQRVIAAFLDEQTAKIDRLIAKTEQFIELSKERRTALITAAVTGQVDVRKSA